MRISWCIFHFKVRITPCVPRCLIAGITICLQRLACWWHCSAFAEWLRKQDWLDIALHFCFALRFQTTCDLFGRPRLVWLPLQQLGLAIPPFNQTKQVEAPRAKVIAGCQIRKSLGEEGLLSVPWIMLSAFHFFALVWFAVLFWDFSECWPKDMSATKSGILPQKGHCLDNRAASKQHPALLQAFGGELSCKCHVWRANSN